MAGAGGSDGQALAPRMEIIEMSDELRSKQEIVNGLNIFLEENEEVSLEELEEFDILEEEETETISEDGSSKEAHDIVRTPQKVSLRSISSMTDEERLNMRIKKFGIITNEEFRKPPENSWPRSQYRHVKTKTRLLFWDIKQGDMLHMKRKERDWNALDFFDILP